MRKHKEIILSILVAAGFWLLAIGSSPEIARSVPCETLPNPKTVTHFISVKLVDGATNEPIKNAQNICTGRTQPVFSGNTRRRWMQHKIDQSRCTQRKNEQQWHRSVCPDPHLYSPNGNYTGIYPHRDTQL